MILDKSGRNPIAKTEIESSINETQAIVSDNVDADLLYSFVSYGNFLGIVKNVFYTRDYEWGQKRIAIQNLVKLDKKGKSASVRDAPSPNLEVYLASDEDLKSFFPLKKFPEKGYLGQVRGTGYPLPLDLDKLCYRNAAILAGIGHGKSTVAVLLACELFASGKKVVVVDPTGEWNRLAQSASSALKLKVPITCNVIPSYVNERDTPPLNQTFQRIENTQNALFEIVDISFAGPSFVNLQAKAKKRCDWAYDVETGLIQMASTHFAKTAVPYDFRTCVIVEEAHQFAPASSDREEQRLLTEVFAIATKEYRKHGLGHIFIDQSLRAISPELQIQTLLIGSTNAPADLNFLRSELGEDVAAAAERTSGPSDLRSWVAFGEAAPLPHTPWELENTRPELIAKLIEKS